jgi:hypothetical protein
LIVTTYELSVDLPFCEFKAIEIGRERFRSGAADCEAIIQELGSVDWHGIFSRKNVDQCSELFINKTRPYNIIIMILYGRVLLVLY